MNDKIKNWDGIEVNSSYITLVEKLRILIY
jgi:hypothetical protein